jgi:hypothetical protein
MLSVAIHCTCWTAAQETTYKSRLVSIFGWFIYNGLIGLPGFTTEEAKSL